jgi:predicted transcriptional regulator
VNGLIDYTKANEMYKTIKNKSEIARMLNLDSSAVHRYLEKDFLPFQTNARYFAQLQRSKDWFYGI